jgi:hypothetical protein
MRLKLTWPARFSLPVPVLTDTLAPTEVMSAGVLALMTTLPLA